MKEFFAVRKGRIPGVYSTWSECEAQTAGYHGAECKKFMYESQAIAYVQKMSSTRLGKRKALKEKQQAMMDDFIESFKKTFQEASRNDRLLKKLKTVSDYPYDLYHVHLYRAAYDMQLKIGELNKKIETLEDHIDEITSDDTIIG